MKLSASAVMFVVLGLAVLVCEPAGAAPPAAEAGSTVSDVRALLAHGRLSDAEVVARELLERARATGGESSLAAADAMDLLLEVLVTAGLSGNLETRELSAAALSIKKRILGTEDPGYGWTLALSGVVEVRAAAGRDMLERALAIQEASPDVEPSRMAWTLYHLGWWRDNCPQAPRGAPTLERALSISEQALGPTHPDTLRVMEAVVGRGDPAICLDKLAATLEELEREGRGSEPAAASLWRYVSHCHANNPSSKFSDLVDALERALEIDLRALGPDSLITAQDYFGLALRLSARGDFAAADHHLERARAAYEKVHGAGSPRMLPVVASYARHALNADRGNTGEWLREALNYRATMFGQDCSNYVELLFDYANWLRHRGECPQARDILEQTQDLLERIESPELTWCLHHLGEAVACMGDTTRAVAYLEQSLALWEQRVPPDALTLWVVLTDLGDYNVRLGNYEVAEAYLRRAIAIQERHLSPQYMGIGTGLMNLGKSYAARGQWVPARDVLERALGIVEHAFGESAARTGHVLRELCAVDLALGELDRAQPICERALTIEKRRRGLGHPYHAQAAARLAAVLLARGKRDEALDRAVEAEDSARNYLLRSARRLSEREALGLKDMEVGRQPGLDIALSIAAGPGASASDVSRVLDQVVRSRAIVFDEMAARHAQALAAAGPERGLISRLESAREVQSRLMVRSFASQAEVTARQLEEASAEVDRAERALASSDAVFAESIERSRTRLPEVLSALPARTALVSYVKYRRLGRSAPFVRTPSYLAFVQRPGRSGATVVDLGAAEPIERLVENWHHELATPPSPETKLARERSYAEAGAALREAVWDPVRARIDGADLVLIVPDGALHLVNFMTLPSTPGRYLVEDALVLHLLSAERDVAALSHPSAPGTGLLLVGAPAFDLDPSVVEERERQTLSSLSASPGERPIYRGTLSCVGLMPARLPPLPRSLTEIEQVASIWSAGAQESGAPVIKLVEGQAAEGAFKRLVPGRRVIHVATHGFFGDAECLAHDSPQGTDARVLNVAGLAFAGADRRSEAGPDQEDGILTADEVASLDLTRAEWVVLSACDSGVGRDVEGEGVLGLRRAFQTAGARTLVMSLWRVEDESASQWMARLYRARARHETTSAAVRSAALELLDARRERGLDTHPYHWGAFVAAGDWR